MKSLTEKTFEGAIKKSDVALVKFSSPGCQPCKILDDRLRKWSPSHKVDIFKVDVDENPGLMRDFKIMSVPTIIVFKKGEEGDRAFGVVSDSKLNELIS